MSELQSPPESAASHLLVDAERRDTDTGHKHGKDPSDKTDAAAAKRRREAARRRRARAEKERRLRQEQLEQERWEALSTYGLTRRSAAAYTAIVTAVSVVFGAIGIAAIVLAPTFELSAKSKILTAAGAWILAFLGFVVAIAIRPIRQARRVLRQREDAARQKAREASEELSDAEDLSQLLRANRKQMEAYDELARVQAKESFRNSQAAIGVGMTVLVAGACISLAATSTTSKVTTAALTAVAGMLSGYIGKTFLRVYENAQQQLTFFFQQPLVNSYILAAERLIKNNYEGKKDEEVARIVDRVLIVLVELARSWDGLLGQQRQRRWGLRHTPSTEDVAAPGQTKVAGA